MEVSVGTGANLAYYPLGAEVIGIDFSSGMLKQARKKLNGLENQRTIELFEMDAQALDFPDDSFRCKEVMKKI